MSALPADLDYLHEARRRDLVCALAARAAGDRERVRYHLAWSRFWVSRIDLLRSLRGLNAALAETLPLH